MKFREGTPGVGEDMKIRRQGNAGQFLRQVVGEAVPVIGGMEDAVDVIEYPVFGNRVVAVVGLEGEKGGVGDVVDALQPVHSVKLALSIGHLLVPFVPVTREALAFAI